MSQIKVPPNDIESEKALLGGLLINPELIRSLTVANEDFYRESHQILYTLIVQMDMEGIVIEPSTIVSELKKQDLLEKFGGQDYLFELADFVSTSASAPYHERVIKELSLKRRIMIFLSTIGESIFNGNNINELVREIKDFASNINPLMGTGDSISQQVIDYVNDASGVFLSTDVYKCLQIKDRVKQKTVSQILSRLIKDEIIERYTNKNGCFRKVNKDFVVADLKNTPDSTFDVRLPFGLERYVEIMPKDLICYSGTPNAGKSCILFEVARLNMRRFKVWYFSTELGAVAFKKRISKHKDTEIDTWMKYINFVDDFDNVIDVIQPNDITIIDYLEVKEGEAFKIPSQLGEIHRKLKNGIAFVALQKNPKKHTLAPAIGGYQTLGKPALFCSIESEFPHTVMKVEKAKNFHDDHINPNGFVIKFKIVNGINLLPVGTWGPEI